MRGIRRLILFIAASTAIAAWANPKVSIAKYAGDRKAAVCLTFDDGIQEHYTLVAPHLDKYGLKGTFGISGKFIGDRDNEFAPRMTWEEVRQIDKRGHEINNHTWSHPNLWEKPEIACREFVLNDSVMVSELGHPALSVLFPFNAFTPEVRAYCDSAYVGSRLFQFGLGQRNNKVTRESIDKWLGEIEKNGEWGVTMTHGIYTAWDQWENPQILWDFFKTLSQKSDTIWTDTFSKVQAYIKERDSSVIDTKMSGSMMTLSITCPLPSQLYHVPLTIKVENISFLAPLSVLQDDMEISYKTIADGIQFDADPHGGPISIFGLDPLAGKKMAVFGDSYCRNHNEPVENTWHYKFAKRHGMQYSNYGINGNCLSIDREIYGKSMLNRYSELPDSLDLLVVIAGHNDAYVVDSIGIETFKERTEQLCDRLIDRYPDATIVFFTPWSVKNLKEAAFKLIIDTIIEVCGSRAIPVFDSARNSNIYVSNEKFRSKYFQNGDEAHLNDKGHERFLPVAEKFILSHLF